MPIVAKATGDGGTFEPAPVGVHQAICVDVIDLGVLDVTWQGQSKRQHKIRVVWQLDELRADGKPYITGKRYTLSLHEKAGLRKDLESWLGRKFGRDEEMGFDVETMIGKNALLNITHQTKDGRVYDSVANVSPLMRSMTPIKARDYVRKQDRPEQGRAGEPSDEPPPLTDDDMDHVPF